MMFYLHSLSGTSLVLWLIYWLPSLLVISSCAWILSGSVAGSTKEEWPQLFEPLASPMLIMMPEVQRKGKRTVYIASMILLFGMGLGYAATLTRDKYWPSKLEDFLIIANNPDGSHVGVDRYGRESSTKWCSGPDDLVPGNKIPAVYYRQMPTCKIIHGWFLGYSVYSYKDGTRMIFPIPKENADAR